MRNIKPTPIRTHLWTSATTLSEIGLVNPSLVLDEIFGILPPEQRREGDVDYPTTVAMLAQQTGIQPAKLIAKLGQLVAMCRDIYWVETAVVADVIISGTNDNKDTAILWDPRGTEEFLQRLSSIDKTAVILVELDDPFLCFTIAMSLREQGWIRTYVQSLR